MTATNTADASRSRVNAFWNASSWSSSACWMYLSPIAAVFITPAKLTASRTIPQIP
jgi:hypothetical protein